MIQGVFPTPVGFYELGRDFTAEEILFLINQETRQNQGNKTGVNSKVLERSELVNIKEFIKSSLLDYIHGVYGTNVGMNLKITQSWINYTGKNQYHHTHTHSNSFISGVFYVQTDKEQDGIVFYDKKYNQFEFDGQEATLWGAGKISFSTPPGQLILFPSYLMHGVDPVLHDQTRISLSFNTFPFGILGNELDLTKLDITEVS